MGVLDQQLIESHVICHLVQQPKLLIRMHGANGQHGINVQFHVVMALKHDIAAVYQQLQQAMLAQVGFPLFAFAFEFLI